MSYEHLSSPRTWALACCLIPAMLQASVTENLIHKQYLVQHHTGQNLGQAISLATPIREGQQRFHGYTDWHIRWQFNWRHNSDGVCTIQSTNTELILTITLPELQSTDKNTQKQFSQYLQNLKHHEEGHANIARQTAQEIDDTITNLASESNCNSLESKANRIANKLIQTSKQQQKNYDQLTGHGKTQGAWLP